MNYLGKIAEAGFDVMLLDADILIAALDESGDLPDGKGMEFFDALLIEKYMDLDPVLERDLEIVGIENPIMVEVEDGRLFLMDGHHRLAWAVVAKAPVPVVFISFDTDVFALDQIMCEGGQYYDHHL